MNDLLNDPFSELKKNLEPVFMHQTRDIYREIQFLKEAVEKYQSNEKNTFTVLVKALREALPHLGQWGISFDSIKKSVDSLVVFHQMPLINWDNFLSHPKISPRFQFSLHKNTSFI